MEEALRIERFAKDTLLHLWKIKLPLPASEKTGKIRESDSTKEIKNVVNYRLQLFRNKLHTNLVVDYDLYKSNDFAFYQYLRKHMDKFLLYPGMMIFDKLLMSLAVVLAMGHICKVHKNTLQEYQNTGPDAWALHFETEWREEFYAAGGWAELKLYAKSCHTYRLTEVLSLSESLNSHFNAGFHLLCFSKFEFRDIIGTFNRLKKGHDSCLSCSNCLPLFDALEFSSFLMTRGKDFRFRNVRLLEGFMQIIFRTLDEEGFARLYNSYLDNIECDNLEEKTKLANDKTFAAHAKIVIKLLFVEDRSEEANKDDNLEHCMFCGKNFDKREVPHLKSIIRKTASEVIDSPKKDSTTEKEASYDEQAETENKKWLRLILALGIEPATSMVNSNLGKELSGQDSSQNVMDSSNKPEVGEKKEKSPKKKNKRKKSR